MVGRTKRLWTDEEKRSICFQTTAPGISVAQVARPYAMNANIIFKWLRDPCYAPEADPVVKASATDVAGFLPVEIIDQPRKGDTTPAIEPGSAAGIIEIDMAGGHRLRINGAYATGGDVFVLDMGKPQRILDIARQMVKLSGRTLKDPDTGEGEIEIVFVGLRPGEKLYEELLVTDDLATTPHVKILRAEETPPDAGEIASLLDDTQAAISKGDAAAVRHIIETRVDGYQSPDGDRRDAKAAL